MNIYILLGIFFLVIFFAFCNKGTVENLTDDDMITAIYNYIQQEQEPAYANYLKMLIDNGNIYLNLNKSDVYFTFRTLKKLGQFTKTSITQELK